MMGYLKSDGITDAAPNNLQGIGLENFRTFSEFNSLDFSSINLITGVNSSGKSSIFKAILLLKDALKHNKGDIKLDFSTQEHRLGTFDNIVNNKSSNSIKIAISMPIGGVKSTYIVFDFKKNPNDYAELEEIIFIDNTTPIIILTKRKPNEEEGKQFYKFIDDEPIIEDVYLEAIIDYEVKEESLHQFNQKLKKIYETTQEIFKDGVQTGLSGESSNITQIEKDIVAFNNSNDKLEIPKNWNDEFYKENLKTIESPKNGKEQVTYMTYNGDDVSNATPSILKTLEKILVKHCYISPSILEREFKVTLNAFSKVSHLSSIRGINSRLYHFSSNNAFVKLLDQYDETTFESWFVNEWLKKLGIGDTISIKKYPEFEFYDIKIESIENEEKVSRRIVDFGYGIAQIITLLIQIGIQGGKYGYQDQGKYEASTIIIEEPEANLHPNWQSKLAEIIIHASDQFKIQFLIETHSEYLIYKFQELIGKRKIRPTDIALYYLNHPKSREKYVNFVPFGIDGQIDYQIFKESAFFDVQNDLKLSLLNIQRDRFLELFEANKVKFGKEDLSDEELLEKLEGFIDEHFNKLDYPAYEDIVKDIVDFDKIDTTKSGKYLVTGKYLHTTLNDNADFSTVVIQYGRTIEHELIRVIKDFISHIASQPNRTSWLNQFNSQKNNLKTNLGGSTAFIRPTTLSSQLEPHHLKRFVDGSSDKFKFGFIMHIFDFMYFISTDYNSSISNTYDDIELYNQFDLFLQNRWNDCTNAKKSFKHIRYFRDERDKAAHTYDNPLIKAEARVYVEKSEAFLKYW